MRKLLLICFSIIALSGCQSVPPLNFVVQDIQPSKHKIDAELKSISVSLASPSEKKGDIEAGMEVVPAFWKSALEDALAKNSIFKDDVTKKANLSVKVLALNAPSFGAEMKTISIAKYQIIDRANGEILYSSEITSDGIVPFNYAFLGVVRARESVNRAVQNNIKKFLEQLDSFDVNKTYYGL
ncbi:UDP-N-acetylglucosamine acyltransferase [Providencia vermicola]|uniref:UDP-N-acetylglucosamine acyltransferase n=1 Tax=Providencia vermicola TaxID=333965 RepID=UPI0032DB61EC